MPILTRSQQRLMDYLQRRLARADAAGPSLRQIARDLELSHTAVAHTLRALEARGVLRREGRYGRVLRLVDAGGREAGGRPRPIPIVGRIAAGLPMYAQPEWDGHLVVDAGIFPGENLFALRVKGSSMQGIGICDMDLAICEPRQFARNGEIVAALVNNEEATVKRFFLKGGRIELHPENPDFDVQRYELGQVLIQGRVMGIVRGPEAMERL
jgi:repressor LexA